MENYLTIEEAAKALKVSIRTVHRWIKKGKLPVWRIEGTVRILESDLKATGFTSGKRGTEEK